MMSWNLAWFWVVSIELGHNSSVDSLHEIVLFVDLLLGFAWFMMVFNWSRTKERFCFLVPPGEIVSGVMCRGVVNKFVAGLVVRLLHGNRLFLCSNLCIWQIKAGTSLVVGVLVPFNVSISSVSNRLVVVAVPGTSGNESSWENHWIVSCVLVLSVARL